MSFGWMSSASLIQALSDFKFSKDRWSIQKHLLVPIDARKTNKKVRSNHKPVTQVLEMWAI
jgi:hypothetical protein